MSFEGKNVVITGGNSGIGRSVARELKKQGARVAIMGRNDRTLEAVRAELGDGTVAVQGDVLKGEDLDRLFTTVQNEFGGIDLLVANAGGGTLTPFAEVTEELFDEQSDTNFRALFFTVQKALPLLNRGASVALMSSVANVKGIAGFSVYSATKAAVRSLARTLAAELAPRGIRVNSISPGPIDTEIFGRLGLPEDQQAQAKEGFVNQVPLARMGRPEEIAQAVSYLGSDNASYVTGVDLAVDGGMTQV